LVISKLLLRLLSSPSMLSLKRAFIFLCLTPLVLVANAQDLRGLHASQANGDYEPAVVHIIELIQAGNLSVALQQADEHLAKFPKSRIGHFLRADVLKAMSEPLRAPGLGLSENAQRVDGFKHQIRNRWRHSKSHKEQGHTLFPSSLIHLGSNPYALVADMPEGRLYLYKNVDGSAELIRDYYMSVGSAGYGKQTEGDNKTPVGVYVINQYIEGKALPDLYGKGAFPVNYPNRFDLYRQRTGYGIWLHGTPSDTYARSPWASEGCFVLSNDDLLDIGQYISADDRTPVILSDQIEWLSADALEQRKAEYYSVINDWKLDWESLNTDAYLQHYSKDLFNLGKDKYKPWAQKKVQVNLSKTFVQVDLELQSLFVYPGEQDMFVVKYKQRYLSNNYSGETTKEQYWQRGASGRWQIIYEGQG
jgi:murein L,D-transpeptidase YafK